MATLNPVAAIRDMSSDPEHARALHDVVGRVTGGGTDTVTVETKLKSIICVMVINETDGAVLATTESASSAYTNSRTIAFTVASGKTYSYRITGFVDRASTIDTTSGAMTITYHPVSQKNG